MTDRKLLSRLIFGSRWLQAPLYLGLIAAQGAYAYHFIHEVWLLLLNASVFTDFEIMQAILALVDMVMISNLLIMVVVGGYETFVSNLALDGHPDKPDWLDHVNPNTLKLKLALSLVSISSVHLLRTFINAENQTDHMIAWQVGIHLCFVFSALALVWIDRLSYHPK